MEEKYTGEFEIKNQIGKNLFETYEVNGKQYTDNIPEDCLIGIRKEQYIIYEQQEEELENLRKIEKEHQKLNGELREEIRKLNNIINEFEEELKEERTRTKYAHDVERFTAYDYMLKRLQELKINTNGVWVNNLLDVIKENNIDVIEYMKSSSEVINSE